MRIINPLQLRPFSHEPGICVLIFGSTWQAQIFPTKIFFSDLLSKETLQVPMPFSCVGPINGFTVLQDLQRGKIRIFGRVRGKYESIDLMEHLPPQIKVQKMEKSGVSLYFGIDKKQEWEGICKRKNLAEIFPFWSHLSQMIPDIPLPSKLLGTMHLLDEKEEENLLHLFESAFHGILCPRLNDERFLGWAKEESIPKSACPIGLLHAGARWIESLFFSEENTGELWSFLPRLPSKRLGNFHTGKITELETSFGDRIDFSFSKKELKKVVIYPGESREIGLKLQRGLNSFRLRHSPNQKGVVQSKKETLLLKKGSCLYLDRFSH